MPTSVNVNCKFCQKAFNVTLKRFNESLKNKWNFYCSTGCQVLFKTKQEVHICSNPKCGKTILRSTDTEHMPVYCSSSCAAKINNTKRIGLTYKSKYSYMNTPKAPKGFRNYAVKTIAVNNLFTPELMKHKITTFVNEHNRVPLKCELIKNYATVSKHFGTWNNLIKACGYTPNQQKFTHRYTALDGHPCDSFSEKIIDDWLYQHNIPHERNIKYAPSSSCTIDFKFKGKLVEFAGLKGGLPKYDTQYAKKLILAKKMNLPIIWLAPKDIYPQANLAKTLEKVLTGGFVFAQSVPT